MDVETLKADYIRLLGPDGVASDAADLEPFLEDRRGLHIGRARLALLPRTTAEVVEVVKLSRTRGVAIIPQGGNTGLCGATVSPDDSVLLNLRRMNAVREIDLDDNAMTVEAGCILADIQAAALAAGRLFPLSLAAEGSCQIGGNLSTNAGGIQVLRYGTARDLVLGLEVVLADGQVLEGLSPLRKDNRGYDLKQLFIGAEGTLGVITAASLKLLPKPVETETAVFVLRDLPAVSEVLALARDAAGESLNAFELVGGSGLDLVARFQPDVPMPWTPRPDWSVVIEIADTRAGGASRKALESLFEAAIERGLATDGVLAENERQRRDLWALRETLSESLRRNGRCFKFDVSTPIRAVVPLIQSVSAAVLARFPQARLVTYGHVADGNIHFNLHAAEGVADSAFAPQEEAITDLIYDETAVRGGSFSAEHGVGRYKVHALEHYRSPVSLALMRQLKRALDPDNLFNPGAVIAMVNPVSGSAGA